MAIGNLLIVEDDGEWRDIYLRNARPQHDGTVKAAENLAEATRAIEEMAFAAAIVDIRLDEGDDENTDGLKVLELLKRSKDHTSAVMLTGKGTVEITRDAIKEFGAFDTRDKVTIEPQEIQALVDEGTDARNQAARIEDDRVPDVLRGRRTVWDWDDEMLKVTGGKRGAAGLYEFLEHLFEPFLPVVGGDEGDRVMKRGRSGIGMGVLWSRAIGRAVVIAFGQEDPLQAALDGGEVIEYVGSPLGKTLRERRKGGLAGIVAEVPDRSRASFSR